MFLLPGKFFRGVHFLIHCYGIFLKMYIYQITIRAHDWFQVVTDLDGNFKMQIGSSGEEGFRDGNFDDAMFNRPQVMLLPSLLILHLLFGRLSSLHLVVLKQ